MSHVRALSRTERLDACEHLLDILRARTLGAAVEAIEGDLHDKSDGFVAALFGKQAWAFAMSYPENRR